MQEAHTTFTLDAKADLKAGGTHGEQVPPTQRFGFVVFYFTWLCQGLVAAHVVSVASRGIFHYSA